ncbi:predicted protein [Nematostella vectensis]|uniref:Nuclear envelope integral membrane protein 1 n=1 Tax=Nematostella vectensis TaxID=45351 RepID=A7RHQ7_NEMVE|nr:nuclear envelope integral membrane protein 1 [Nematostella vectensis]EDO48896.1 predicted protein [Nematostella vectensis]|eukprot:XP_001640959.1 predicted protein [Nematostella vectensis]
MAEILKKCEILLCFSCLSSLLLLNSCSATAQKCNVLEVSQLTRSAQPVDFPVREKFAPVCFLGFEQVSLYHIWSSVSITLREEEIEGSQIHYSDSCEALYEAKDPALARRMLSWFADLDALTTQQINLSPFGNSCFALHFPERQLLLHLKVQLKPIHWHYPLVFIVGLILFWEADSLSRSVTFYYGSGIVLGVVVSLLLAVFLLHRLIPSKSGAYMLLAGGWSISLFVLQWTWNNLVDLVLDRNVFVITYFTIAGLVSFGLCYYNGPVSNQRGLDLIRWTIQFIAVYLMYKGIQPESLSLAVLIIALLTFFLRNVNLMQKAINILPKDCVPWRVRYMLFPPDLRLLSEHEFELQGEMETRRALQELREYCNSPDCQAWKVLSRVHDPRRLAKFVTDGDHISDDEYRAYEDGAYTYPVEDPFTDDEAPS